MPDIKNKDIPENQETDANNSPSEADQQMDPVSDALASFAVKWTNSMGEPEEGPLYVLWDLIESYKIDIFDVSLLKITEDFIHFLNTAENLKIELASSFTVMASQLLYYKSKALLPDPGFDDSDEEPRLPPELVQQLLEYRKFQLVADQLRNRESIAAGVLPREKVIIPDHFSDENGWIDVSIVDLIAAYSRLLQRLELKNAPEDIYEITSEEFSVDEKIQLIKNELLHKQSFSFNRLFETISSSNLGEFVATFLALLELTRMGEIIVRQKMNFAEIMIFKKSTVVI